MTSGGQVVRRVDGLETQPLGCWRLVREHPVWVVDQWPACPYRWEDHRCGLAPSGPDEGEVGGKALTADRSEFAPGYRHRIGRARRGQAVEQVVDRVGHRVLLKCARGLLLQDRRAG